MDEGANLIAQLKEMHKNGILTDAELSEKIAAVRSRQLRDTTNPSDAPSLKDRLRAFFQHRKLAGILLFSVLVPASGLFIHYMSTHTYGAVASLLGVGNSDDHGYSDLCLLAGDPRNPTSMGQRVSYVLAPMKDGGATVNWDGTAAKVILHIRGTVKKTGEEGDTELELERTANAAPLPDCKNAREGALAVRMSNEGGTFKGQLLTYFLQELTLAAISYEQMQNLGYSPPGVTPKADPTSHADAFGAAPDALAEAPFDLCYHLDSCSKGKVLGEQTVNANQSERLVKATMQFTDPVQVQSADDAVRNPHWGSPEQIYAICSRERPTLIFRTDDGQWLAEELDVASFLGIQADNITIYVNICHKGEADKVMSDLGAYGYSPLEDGGRGQFSVKSPEALFDDH